MKDKQVPFNAPLNELDTEMQTQGCRANNPDICGNNGLSTCALCNTSGICYTPSKRWKKQYQLLKEQNK